MKLTSKVVVFATFITISAFLSMAYMGCKKDPKKPTVNLCANVTCQNGGTCFKGFCTCPSGYEGEYCQTKSNYRYLGDWEISDNIIGSSKPANIGKQNTYTINISAEGSSATELRMKGFLGNSTYGDLLLRLGLAPAKMEVDNQIIDIDSLALPTDFVFTRNQSIANTYISVQKGNGNINGLGTSISGTCYMIYQDTAGPVLDTLSFTGTFKQ